MEDREAACYICGKSFFVTKKTLRTKYLHCENCTKGRDKQKDEVVDRLLEEANETK